MDDYLDYFEYGNGLGFTYGDGNGSGSGGYYLRGNGFGFGLDNMYFNTEKSYSFSLKNSIRESVNG
jgi:hypothetical protein